MATKNCLICGKEFTPCNTCVVGVSDERNWRKVVCCREHFFYLDPIFDYTRKKISKAEAKETLEGTIKEYGEITFADNIQSIVSEILAEDKKTKRRVKTIEETVDENTTDENKID